MNDERARRAFPPRDPDANKGDFGYIALVGGSLPYSGAIRLAAMANAAMRSGAGVCTVAAPRSICRIIAPQILEATLYPLSEEGDFFSFREEEFEDLARRYRVICFGMGIGNTDETKKAVRWLLANYAGTLILDADGLNALAELLREERSASLKDNADGDSAKRGPIASSALLHEKKCSLVLTPHFGEYSRLSGISVENAKKDPVRACQSLAGALRAVVLLKGRTTVIADGRNALPAGGASDKPSCATDPAAAVPVLLSETGTPGMATAGSGDVLSGILAALAAQNPTDLFLATAVAAYVNGLAGELAAAEHGEISMTAGDTARNVEQTIYQIKRKDPML